MLSLELPTDIEKNFIDVVQRNFNGNVQAAITSFLILYEKYRWKEQIHKDVESIRTEVRKKGGVSSKDIDHAIKKYRKTAAKSNG